MIAVGSLFAGIGGFDAGFEAAGMRTVWQVEIDAAARGVLAYRFPDAQRFTDIREVGRHCLAPVDVICGGFPCQDLSVAGKRAGLAGARSGLFYEMVRVIHDVARTNRRLGRPAPLLVWENVPGLLSSDNGRDFARVLLALDRGGYRGAWRVLDARHFGVAQRRRRVFGVFARDDIGMRRCAEILALTEGLRGDTAPGGCAGARAAGDVSRSLTTGSGGGRHDKQSMTVAALTRNGVGTCGADDNQGQAGHLIAAPLTGNPYADRAAEENNLIAHALNANATGRYDGTVETLIAHTLRAEGHDASEDGTGRGVPLVPVAFDCKAAGETSFAIGDIPGALRGEGHGGWHAAAMVDAMAVRRLTPRECERLQGFKDDWTRYRLNIVGDAIEQADASRYRQLGNAVNRNVAESLGHRIVRVLGGMA